MQYHRIILLLILLLKPHLTEESGYNCSDFYEIYGRHLVECPPAKFMLTDHLVECFANYSKSLEVKSKLYLKTNYISLTLTLSSKLPIHFSGTPFFLAGNSNRYWCWSRGDVSEDQIENRILSTAIVDDYELTKLIKKPFSVRYLSNGTHYKCDFSKEWADTWYIFTEDNTSPCVTNTSLAVNVKFKAYDNNL